ncbi:hypothetical protein [Thermobaculum terrenum]|uniref:hypothetical protein n=1 Tax=Thermobaculum terrenum TaxID=166501 RepID=UPI0002D95A20|nr:hypothetical protein [Thermobaculum terrenum]
MEPRLLVRTDGTYVFLEVNPMGAWGWLQEHTGLPIARSIARALAATATPRSY